MELSDALAHLDDARRQTALAPQPAAQPTPADFVHLLPQQAPEAAELVSRLQAFCAAGGVTLASLSGSRAAATAGTLGRQDLEVELHGDYRAVKHVLELWVNHAESATVRSMRLRAAGAGDDKLQAQAVLAVWARGAQADAPEGAAVAVPGR
ncbi:MAG: hypothetical protein JNM97_23475 [Rhodoferax sp.]|nr:hypothetical protein [Rhodoferax sp.]